MMWFQLESKGLGNRRVYGVVPESSTDLRP